MPALIIIRKQKNKGVEGFYPHTKLSTYIPNKKELHITAHASTPVLANELPVYPGKSSMWILDNR